MSITQDRPVREEQPLQERVILFINLSDSRCGACNRNADPMEEVHTMATMKGIGCGARYTAVSSHYTGRALEERVQEMRPDLEFIPAIEAFRS